MDGGPCRSSSDGEPAKPSRRTASCSARSAPPVACQLGGVGVVNSMLGASGASLVPRKYFARREKPLAATRLSGEVETASCAS